MRVDPRCANTHNCFGPTLGRWWNTEASSSVRRDCHEKNDTSVLVCNSSHSNFLQRMHKMHCNYWVFSFQMRYSTFLYLIWVQRYGQKYLNSLFQICGFCKNKILSKLCIQFCIIFHNFSIKNMIPYLLPLNKHFYVLAILCASTIRNHP